MHLHKFVDFWGCIPMIRTFFRYNYNVQKQIYGEYLSAASGFMQNRFFCILNNLLKYGRRQSHRGRDEIGVSANADKSSVSCGNESIFDSHVRIIIEFYVLFSDSCRNDFSENSARYESGLWNKRVKTIHENRTKTFAKKLLLTALQDSQFSMSYSNPHGGPKCRLFCLCLVGSIVFFVSVWIRLFGIKRYVNNFFLLFRLFWIIEKSEVILCIVFCRALFYSVFFLFLSAATYAANHIMTRHCNAGESLPHNVLSQNYMSFEHYKTASRLSIHTKGLGCASVFAADIFQTKTFRASSALELICSSYRFCGQGRLLYAR